MRKEEFLNSIKVDQATIDNCNQAGKNFNAQNENGQYATGNNEKEIAQTTGFDRDGDFGESETTKTGVENGSNNIGNEESLGIEGAVNNDIDSGIDGGIDM